MYELTEEEMEQLKAFRFSCHHSLLRSSVKASDLLESRTMKLFLQQILPKLNAPDDKTAASMLMKRYAFTAVIVLYAMSVFNKGLDACIENIAIEVDDSKEKWLPDIRFESGKVTIPDGDRDLWRQRILKDLFAENIDRLIKKISKDVKISKLILWENIAIYLFWLYETVLSNPKFDQIRERITDDFHHILMENGQTFGGYSQNPLSRFYKPKCYHPVLEESIRIRTTCCLYYRTTKNGSRCKTCPDVCRPLTGTV
jgi:ferric iron reductase protein FhuF